MVNERPSRRASAVSVLLIVFGLPAALGGQTPPETFGEEVEVRETSVVALPPGGDSEPPASEAVTIGIDGLAQRVTRVERVFEGRRGDWEFTVYLDPQLAGSRTRFLAALALAQRAESLAALGTVEVLAAEGGRPVLARTDSWQKIEAALLSRALEAKRRLDRGAAATERPGWDLFRQRLALLLGALESRGAGGPRALFLPSDGLHAAAEAEGLSRIARTLAGRGWVTIPMPWSELPSEGSAARLSEFESWKEGADGRDVSAGQRRYVIDLGRAMRHLRGAAESPRAESSGMEPEFLALENLADPTSGLLARRDAELRAALANLARRWRVWFQTAHPADGELRSLEVRLDDQRLDAPRWVLSPKVH